MTQHLNDFDRFGHPVRAHGTTVLGIKRNGKVAMAGDGQVTLGDMVVKHGTRKVRTMQDGAIVVGFAGAVADALTLLSKFEAQLKAWDGNLRKAAVELTKEWRTERYLRRLDAQLLVGDGDALLMLSGEGDVIEPDDGVAAIGSGTPYATAAARALMLHTELDARAICQAAMEITADLCIFTNNRITLAVAGEKPHHNGDLPLPENTAPADAGDEEADADEERS
ncbi:MAG: ATP-dependent protease subunit HslV [Thermomicrobiales bacterium]|nr:ATP-dependent protease subunit HslV [Thermomicrobiales bacterium]